MIEPHEDVVIYPGTDRVLVAGQFRATASLTGASALRFRVAIHALDMQPLVGEGEFLIQPGEPQAEWVGRVLVLPSSLDA